MHLIEKQRLFWPGLSADISHKRGQCKNCNENAPSQPDEPLITTPEPTFPFEQVASDIYQKGRSYYHIYADRLSGWTEVAKIKSPAFKHLRKDLQKWFQTYGIPNQIASDGGPPYNSHEYDRLLKKWGISKRLSSAHYPQSNGRAEIAVKAMKRTLDGNVNPLTGDIDTDEAMKAIMTHRNTPSQEKGVSPSEILFGRRIRDHLPDGSRQVNQKTQPRRARDKKGETPSNRKPLQPLKLGDRVRIQNQIGNSPKKWNNTGKIIEVKPYRQYLVQPDGSKRATLRNRKFLKKTIEPSYGISSMTRRCNSRNRNQLGNKAADTMVTDNQRINTADVESTENITNVDINVDTEQTLLDTTVAQNLTDRNTASVSQEEETAEVLSSQQSSPIPTQSTSPQAPPLSPVHRLETQNRPAINEFQEAPQGVRRSTRSRKETKRLICEV
jgi:hypothetical protein